MAQPLLNGAAMHRTVSFLLLLVGPVAACSAATPENSTPSGQSVDTSAVYNFGALAHPGSCLDIRAGSSANGAQVQEWQCNGTPAQSFNLRDAGNGNVMLVNASSGKCVDVAAAGTANGTRIQLYDCNGTPAQSFSMQSAGGTFVHFVNTNSNKCVDVQSANPNDGTLVQLYDCNGTPAQTWNSTVVGSMGGGGGSGGRPTRLRVTNKCNQTIWLAHSDNVPDAQNVALNPGQSHDVAIPSSALSATRFWPKIGCDGSGHACAMGDNGQGGGVPCPSTGCQPPLDSKFEVSFADEGSSDATWYNLSQVDGYTLPFKVVPTGAGAGQGSCVVSDCSGLSLDQCPSAENMSGSGTFPAYASEDLRVRNANGEVVACMSPCKKWNFPAPYGLGDSEGAEPGLHMCCPTPIAPSSGQCTEANAYRLHEPRSSVVRTGSAC